MSNQIFLFQHSVTRLEEPYTSNCIRTWIETDLDRTYMADEKPLYSMGVSTSLTNLD